MHKKNCKLVSASSENYNDYHKIRSEKINLYWTGYNSPPDYDEFKKWYINRINDPSRDIFLMYCNNNCVGSLHIDYYENYAAIGYSVKEAYSGEGIGTLIVGKALQLLKEENRSGKSITTIKAWINQKNIASIKVVEKNNFYNSGNDKMKIRFGKKELYYEYEIKI